ncbi:MAG: hypothetical protein OXB92_11400 [Acidimicrobiaceae bacterium]|nr:hypothetical protein [Acidimicrobiia bacterium]MCY4494449.1 hypothetical protein [Acidimicrobiaceae bacterium]
MNRITPLIAVLAFAINAAATAAAATGTDDILTDSGQANANTGQAETVFVGFEAEQYAIDFGVTTVEALRRLDRIPELKKIIQEAVAAESGRAAGWGIVHEPRFGGWVYLVGDTEPTQATKDLVARHSDLYADTGATHTFAELKAAMSNRSNFEAIPASIRDRIAYREIDVRSNSIVVAIDRDQPPARTDETIPITERPIEAMEFEATHTMDELLAALDNNVDREAIPVSMRDRIAYTDIDARTNSIVVAIDSDIPPVPVDDTVPVVDRPIESLDLPQAAEALEALLEQATGLPFSVVLGSRAAPGVG